MRLSDKSDGIFCSDENLVGRKILHHKKVCQ